MNSLGNMITPNQKAIAVIKHIIGDEKDFDKRLEKLKEVFDKIEVIRKKQDPSVREWRYDTDLGLDVRVDVWSKGSRPGNFKIVDDYFNKNLNSSRTVYSIPLQTIFYGSPGCGKSHEVKDLLINNNIVDDYQFRTTFHPDSDYYSFIGAYKPKKDIITGSIIYDFSPQVFTKAYIHAWKNPNKDVALVIEEINRGNCAQIFGDLFQLLDRDKDGYSEYPIDADEDLKQYLEENLGVNNEGIKGGKLKLPPNLYIVATMNTSDQSLFPMDSAFKRRWAWKYMPIDYNNQDSAKFNININGTDYPWHDFLKQINYKIYAITNSEDKMLGNFFIKSSIDEEEFVDKVMFYLWNDVLKLEYASGNDYFFKKEDNSKFIFSDLYDSKTRTSILESFMEYLGLKFVVL